MSLSYEQIKETEHKAESAAREQFHGMSLQELSGQVQKFHSTYQDLVERAFEEHDWVCSSYFEEMLEHAYPDSDYLKRRELADEIEKLILDRLGDPEETVSQESIISAETSKEAAIFMIAENFSDDQILELEKQAQKNIPAEEFPDNFEDHKAEWLARWISRRWIRLSDATDISTTR